MGLCEESGPAEVEIKMLIKKESRLGIICSPRQEEETERRVLMPRDNQE